ncbi:MAG: Nif11-like leader peptide family natural product precursor [Elainella sp.]
MSGWVGVNLYQFEILVGESPMPVSQIASFAEKAKTDAELQNKLKACERTKELVALSQEYGFAFAEEELYPPNQPAFEPEQLHPKLVKALLR